MKNKILSLTAAILVIFMLAPIVSAERSYGPSAVSTRIDDIIGYYMDIAGVGSTAELISSDIPDWAKFALIRHDQALSSRELADSFLDSMKSTKNPVEKQRYALFALMTGFIAPGELSGVLDETIESGGIMSLVFGLHLQNNGVPSKTMTSGDTVSQILSMRTPDGGWAVSGDAANPDVTAMVLQAIAPYIGDRDVSRAVTDAISLLSEMQTEDGGFVSYGAENSESVSQVMLALTSLCINPFCDQFASDYGDLLTVLDTYAVGYGSYSHTVGADTNATATFEALCALTALERYYDGRNPIYIYSENDVGTDAEPVEPDHTDTGSDETKVAAFPEDTDESVEGDDTNTASYKPYAIAVILLLLAAVIIIFIAKKRLHASDYIIAVLVAVILLLLVLFIDIKSPDDYYGHADTANTVGYVTFTIDASAADSGIIVDSVRFPIHKSETVYTLTVSVCRQYGIKLESDVGGSYIEGIADIYEFEHGALSGWTYTVNGESLSVGCGDAEISDGDTVCWIYTTEIGKNIGEN